VPQSTTPPREVEPWTSTGSLSRLRRAKRSEMPIYEYACEKCESEFEVEQRITDSPVKSCPHCKSKKVKRLISRTSFVLKGGGWYSDLYSSSGAKKDKDATSDSDGDKAASKSADSKSESKKDSKSEDTSKSKDKAGAKKKSKGSKAVA
jgi:putative FmdB family regulatory protein